MRAALLFMVVLLAACNRVGEDTIDAAEMAKSAVICREQSTASRYLVINSIWKENLIGRKVFSGSVLNKARFTTFDELLLTFHFFDSLNVKVGERSFFAKETLAPQKVYKFKIKTFAPVPTQSYTYSVKGRVLK